MFLMKTILGVTGLAVLAFSGGQVHQSQKVVQLHGGDHHNISVDFTADENGHLMTLDINGETLTPDLEGMEIGDTRTFTTSEGSEITVERKDEHSYELNGGDGDINIIVGGHEGGPGEHVWISADGEVHGEFDGDMIFIGGEASNTVTISGLSDLGEDQKQAIIDAIRAAGVEKDVQFSDANIRLHHGAPGTLQEILIDGADIHSPHGNHFKFKTGDHDGDVIIVKELKKKKKMN